MGCEAPADDQLERLRDLTGRFTRYLEVTGQRQPGTGSDQDSVVSYFPEWLGNSLIGGDLPWDQATRSTIQEFLAEYTLHDSIWINLIVGTSDDGEVLAVIRWDTFWTRGRVPHPGSAIANWPILIIRLPRVEGVRLEGFATTTQTTRTISTASSVGVDEGGIQLTEIRDVEGGRILLEHDAAVEILCLAHDRSVLPVPGLGDNNVVSERR
jgi:hypothetical protein